VLRYSSAPVPGNARIIAYGAALIGAADVDLLQDSAFNLYYLDSNLAPILIGALAAPACIYSYNGVAIICDGSYIKYLPDTTKIKMAYDAGTGSAGYQFENLAGKKDNTLALGNGANIRLAWKFTSQTWDAGYTIPPTRAQAMLSKSGSPAGDITARVRLVSDDSIMAEAVLAKAEDLTTTAELQDVLLTVTTEMDPASQYYLSLEYAAGDASNYVNLHCSAVTAGHAAIYTATWADDTGRDPIMALSPGRPPKASFATVWDRRLWVVSPDTPGRADFCGLTHLDWSTAGLAGYVSAVDDNDANYPIGAMAPLYTDLYLFGTKDRPYIYRITGDAPANYTGSQILQKIWSVPDAVINTVSDIWSASDIGVETITGVQAYGDVRAHPVSEPVADRIDGYFDADTIRMAYYARHGQCWLVMPDYHRILVARVVSPVVRRGSVQPRYPWMEYELYRADFSTDAYGWEKSAAGVNEYYLVGQQAILGTAGGDYLGTADGTSGILLAQSAAVDPGVEAAPDFITVDNRVAVKGTPGTLADGSWGYGDNDSLGFSTVYYRDDAGDPETTGKRLMSVLVPTCMAPAHGDLILGGSDGYLYTIGGNVYLDTGQVHTYPRLRAAEVSLPFRFANLTGVQLVASGRGGVTLDMQLFVNGADYTPALTLPMATPISDGLTLGEATMILKDATFPIAPGQSALPWKKLNINARSFQLAAVNILVTGPAVYIDGFVLRYKPLQQ